MATREQVEDAYDRLRVRMASWHKYREQHVSRLMPIRSDRRGIIDDAMRVSTAVDAFVRYSRAADRLKAKLEELAASV